MTFGVISNICFGITKSHVFIFSTSALAAVSLMSYPTTASMMSFNVTRNEQGKIQGVFTSLNALSSALGPLFLNFIFDKTVGGAFLGSGSMFFVAALIYFIGTILSGFLPPDQSNSKNGKNTSEILQELLAEDINVL